MKIHLIVPLKNTGFLLEANNKIIKSIASGLLLFAIVILISKSFYLAKSNNIIGIELISPSLLTERGYDIQNSIKNNGKLLHIPCNTAEKCEKKTEEFDSTYLKNIQDFLQTNPSIDAIDWVVENNLSTNVLAEYRGFYLHHYQTILFPLRELKAGSYSTILASQYGFASLIPAILIGNNSFVWYPTLSMALLIAFISTIFFLKRDDSKSLTFAGICLLIALCENMGAMKLSPGFSIYRFVPTWLLIYLSYKSLINEKLKHSFFMGLALALINSLQMNLLVVIINMLTALFLKIRKYKVNNSDIITQSICLALAFQYIAYLISSDDFSQRLFSSLEEGRKNYLYIELIFLFPFAIFMAKKFIFKKNESPVDIFCYFSYLGMSTYAISFPGSPQHFCSFIIMASFPIYFLATGVTKNKFLGIIFLTPLFLTAYHYSYFNLPKRLEINTPTFFENKEFGSELTFTTPSNIDLIYKQYKELTNPYSPDDGVLNLTSDSKYFAAVSGKNPPQKNYDLYIYTPKLNINSLAFKEKLVKNRIKFIAIYSPLFLNNLHNYLKYKLSVTTEPSFQSELKFHLSTIEEQISLSSNKLYNLKTCNDRYCVYQL